MAFASVGLAFVAGLLSTLSPCVLPLLPLVLGAATSKHRFGPAALAGGLALSFAAISLFLAAVGFAIGIDDGMFRKVAAVVLVVLGGAICIPWIERRFVHVAGPFARWSERRLGDRVADGLGGQFAIGCSWAPCGALAWVRHSALSRSSPSRDATSVRRLRRRCFWSRGRDPAPDRGIALTCDSLRWRGPLMSGGKGLKNLLGISLVVFGLLTLTGLDHALEAALVSASPPWLTTLTTRF